MRKIKKRYTVSAHSGSKCIVIAEFCFSYGDSALPFDEPIVKEAEAPVIIVLRYRDCLKSRGKDQLNISICFSDGPEVTLKRERMNL